MKNILAIIFIFSSFLLKAQKWELISEDHIADITNVGERLYIVGYQGYESFIGISNDGGVSWNKVILNPYITVEGAPICVGFFNANNGIIGIKGSNSKEYLKTTDGGLTWKAFTPNLNTNCFIPQPYDFVTVNEFIGIITQFQSGNYIMTKDGGDTWTCETQFTTSWAPNFTSLNQSTFYNFDQNGLFKSSDTGMSWSTALDINNLSAYFIQNENIGYAITAYYDNIEAYPVLYKTLDGWGTSKITPLTTFKDRLVSNIALVDSEHLYFFLGDSIYYSTDEDNSIKFLQKLEFEPFKVKRINNMWYATGRGLAKYKPDGIVTSISKHYRFENSLVYPNPITNSRIRLNTNDFNSYELYDLNGTLIEEGLIDDSVIEINPMLEGLYIIRVKNPNESYHKNIKIIIE